MVDLQNKNKKKQQKRAQKTALLQFAVQTFFFSFDLYHPGFLLEQLICGKKENFKKWGNKKQESFSKKNVKFGIHSMTSMTESFEGSGNSHVLSINEKRRRSQVGVEIPFVILFLTKASSTERKQQLSFSRKSIHWGNKDSQRTQPPLTF